jgi:hypothetical protein
MIKNAYMTPKHQALYCLVREWKLEGRSFTQGAIAAALSTNSPQIHYWMGELERWGWVELSDTPCRQYSDRISVVRDLLYPELERFYEYEKARANRLEQELQQFRKLLKREAA